VLAAAIVWPGSFLPGSVDRGLCSSSDKRSLCLDCRVLLSGRFRGAGVRDRLGCGPFPESRARLGSPVPGAP